MSELYYKSMIKLELDKVLQLLADCAGSADGKKACLQLVPTSDAEDVRRLLAETTAASDFSQITVYHTIFENATAKSAHL